MLRGRKSEFQSIKGRDVDDMLSQGTDYLVCPDHKNSKTHGSMAKWLTPGARRAVELYRQVPRRPEVQTFLVPAMESISRVDREGAAGATDSCWAPCALATTFFLVHRYNSTCCADEQGTLLCDVYVTARVRSVQRLKAGGA